MADSKLADLTAITTPADDDLLYVVHDPAGTPVDRKITVANLLGASVLAVTSYKPGTDSTSAYTTTSASFVDVDATNAAVTFTAPASGKVLVRLTAPAASASGGALTFWGLREGAADVSGTGGIAAGHGSATIPDSLSRSIYVTGLTAGNSYTYKWGFRAASGNTAYIAAGPTYGALAMEVLSCP